MRNGAGWGTDGAPAAEKNVKKRKSNKRTDKGEAKQPKTGNYVKSALNTNSYYNSCALDI